MIGHERHGLVGVIGEDLLRNGKIPLLLMAAVLVSAVLVVTTAHKTRLLTAERERLLLERDALDIEWRNLILEENSLGIIAALSGSRRRNCKWGMSIRHRKILWLSNELNRYPIQHESSPYRKVKTPGRSSQLCQLAFCVAL